MLEHILRYQRYHGAHSVIPEITWCTFFDSRDNYIGAHSVLAEKSCWCTFFDNLDELVPILLYQRCHDGVQSVTAKISY